MVVQDTVVIVRRSHTHPSVVADEGAQRRTVRELIRHHPRVMSGCPSAGRSSHPLRCGARREGRASKRGGTDNMALMVSDVREVVDSVSD